MVDRKKKMLRRNGYLAAVCALLLAGMLSGCAGGGGQPIHEGVEMSAARGDKLWKLDAKSELRFSHENPDVQALYRVYLKAPLSERAHHLLHTKH